ncbi:MAG: Bax inhibitor-1 family protein [Halioglobus sp.]
MNSQTPAQGTTREQALATNKVLRNTYALPAMTLLFSAATAMGGTGLVFLGLSAYALSSRRDFSFMGSFLFVGILVGFLAALAAVFFEMPALALTVSAMFVTLMSGLILFETSNIIHGDETNYIMATVTLFVAIFNLFTSLLHLLGAFGGQE